MKSKSTSESLMIRACCACVPDRVVTNQEFSAWMKTSDRWITERTGIGARHWARSGDDSISGPSLLEMAKVASEEALRLSSRKSVDLLIGVSITPVHEMSGIAAPLAHALFPAGSLQAIEVRNHCSGFLYGLQVAKALLLGGASEASSALVVAGEVQSTGLLLDDRGRDTAVLFGDGVAACVLERDERTGLGVLNSVFRSLPEYATALGVPRPGFASLPILAESDFEGEEPGFAPKMDGRQIFKLASQGMPKSILALCEKSGCDVKDFQRIIPHQANARIIQMLAHELAIQNEVFCNIDRFGNTTSGSIPIAMRESIAAQSLANSENICFVSFGAGLTSVAMHYRADGNEVAGDLICVK